MTTQEIIKKLKQSYKLFTDYIDTLSEEHFLFSEDKTWSAGQQLEHVCKSIVPLNKYMALPNFTKRLMFGTSKKEARNYDKVVSVYQEKLNQGGKAPSEYEPEIVLFNAKEKFNSKLHYNLNKFLTSIEKMSEKDLDKYQIPHPLIGKLSIREMLYFSDYHVLHHLKSIQNKLN